MITVFYDGYCGLCAKEIAYYKSIAPKGRFKWVDITKTPEPFEALGYPVHEGLKALHVMDTKGKIQIGVRAFITIWRALPKWRVLAFFANLPVVVHILDFVYRRFAAWRFKRLGYQCKIDP